MTDTALKRFLDRVADLVLVGLLTLTAGLPVLTGLAALTAAAATLDGAGSGSLAARFVDGFRRALRPSLKPQLALLAALTVGVVDLGVGLRWATAGHHATLAGPALACGLLLVGSAVILPPYLAVLPHPDGLPSGARLRQAALLAYGRPWASLRIAATALVLVLAGGAVPVLSPLLVGVYAMTAAGVVRRVLHRLNPPSLCAARPGPLGAGSTRAAD